MAYENFTTYDETDEGTNVTVIAAKVSWAALQGNHTSHVSDSKGVAHFSGDFEHLFECQYDNVTGNGINCFWALANSQKNRYAIISDSEDAATLYHTLTNQIKIEVIENGSATADLYFGSSEGTAYYITLARDDDGGANNTGQYTVEIRTGSHAGVLVDTITVDCAVGEQNDFEYVFGLMSNDNGDSGDIADGFTQNLDLQEVPVGAAGIMTTNTGFWGPTF